jgi:CubicO group peptidase (beta-lactamase class C family)
VSAELETLAGKLGRRLADAQAKERIPGPSAAVARDGEIVWAEAIGVADVEAGREATTEDQYRIGSITKVVTAVCIMQLRDEGRLDLDDPLSAHITESAHRGPTIRRMLSHLSGLQREPVGDVWVTMVMPTMEDVVASIGDAELVLKPGEEWHYSNLAFALLGEIVQRLRGAPYPDVIRERVFEPLGMTRTTWTPTAPKAVGYMVAPYDDTVTVEAEIESEGFGPAGQLWSTPSDLVRLGSFLAKPSGDVLAAKTVDEMHAVQAMYDAQWTLGWGLGVELHRSAGGFAAGHGGAMPGFLAQLLYDRSRGLAVAVTSNSGSRNDPSGVAAGMLDDARRELPAQIERWTPGDPVPPQLAGVPGRWWTEGEEFVFTYRNGHLEARHSASPPDRPPAVFAADGEDRYRVESGRERGELLVLVRDGEGRVSELRWAGYPVTRTPETFG